MSKNRIPYTTTDGEFLFQRQKSVKYSRMYTMNIIHIIILKPTFNLELEKADLAHFNRKLIYLSTPSFFAYVIYSVLAKLMRH